MKRFAVFALACIALIHPGGAQAQPSTCGPAGRESATKLHVDVEGVRSNDGLVAVTLYADDSKRFLASRGSLYVARVPAKAGTTRVCIYLPEPGVYALAVYHDADGNRKINRSAIGLPTEAVGFSNNPRLFLSIPSFRAVRLSVPESDMVTGVRLRYP